MRVNKNAGLVAIAVAALMVQDAHAYLDPGTASMALQALVAIIAGALLFFKTSWYRTKAFFSKLINRK